MTCLFCDRSRGAVRHLVARGPVAICNDCIARCAALCTEAGVAVEPPKTRAGQIVDVAWADVAADAREVVIAMLAEEIDGLNRAIECAQARGLLANAVRLSARRRNAESALRALGYAEAIHALCIDDYLEALPEWDDLDAMSRQFVHATLLRRVDPCITEANAAANCNLDVYAARMIEIAAAYRAAAHALGWGSATFAIAG